MWKIVSYIVFFVFISLIFKYCQIDYNYTDVKDYLSALLGVSSMVFTIMGIWIAFIYPNALQRLVNPEKIKNVDFSETLAETKRLESLVGSIIKSSIVAMMILVIYVGKIIFSSVLLQPENIILFDSLFLSFIIVLGFLQVESLLYVIYSNLMFVNELHNKREDREADNDI